MNRLHRRAAIGTVATAQLLRGITSLAAGIGMILARNRLSVRDRARDSPLAVPMIWVFLGLLTSANGQRRPVSAVAGRKPS